MGWDFHSSFDDFKGPNHMRKFGMKRAIVGAAIAALAMNASAAHAATPAAAAAESDEGKYRADRCSLANNQ